MRALLLPLLLLWFNGFGQVIEHRLILFGDAGEINNGQKQSINKAIELLLPNKTSVYFLGDNIYPYGMSLESKQRKETIDILESQFLPFIKKNTSVTFIPGNHDWDHSRQLGLEKIKAQEAYILSQNITNLQFVPKAGTSDIFSKEITNSAKVILFDSEYWLFPFHANPDSALSIDVRNRFLEDLKTELELNTGKTIFILSHHPMRSYGEHGKNITWKDHVFPLTRISKNLYVPLPILGSLYPLVRTKIFHSAEDISHPLYKNLVKDITEITNKYPNVVFVAGHDHGLQLIEDNNFIQIVTGSGAKRSFIASHSTQKFVSNKQGFCMVDFLDTGDFTITYFTVSNDQINKSYEFTIPKLK
ncbi:metallophosphoesterase [Sphingobacterium bovistauri]|uniref:Metallophosphoesterase n=1 Tax=Sphingobacterium bovistauri TaxID=2781959 RepID=A0ABS7Z432_9SPHI|nr:metallophosphoesterase [Sphingobacterium bovistauri]MCA5004941.1 metallophosphoesterase [Sphingobacterium bovistauri]